MSANPMFDFLPSDAPAIAIGQWVPSGYYRKDGQFCPVVELVNAHPKAHSVSGKCAKVIFEDVESFVEAVRAACGEDNKKRVRAKQDAWEAKKRGKETDAKTEPKTEPATRKANPLAGFNVGN